MLRFDQFTRSAQHAAQRAAEVMQRYSHNQIDTEHVLVALIEPPQGVISQLLQCLEVDAYALSQGLDHILRNTSQGDLVEVGPGQVLITERVVRMIDRGIEETSRLHDELISDEHLLLGILSESDTPAVRLLQDAGLTHDRVDRTIQEMRQ